MKHKILLGLLALGLTFTMAGCSSNSSSSGGNSISAPKKVSFVQQATHESGTHVWLHVRSESGEVEKNAIVNYAYILSNGKMKKYNIFDNSVTLGKMSKLNDSQAIKLIKAQDKKYATSGASQEVENYLSGKNLVGQETDFDENARKVSRGNFAVYATLRSPSEGGDTINPPEQASSSAVFGVTDLRPYGIKEDDEEYGKAIIKHIKNTPYKEPKYQTIKVNNSTDNSGNKIISQKVSYDGIEMFDGLQAWENVYRYAKKNKADFLKLIKATSTKYYYTDLKTVEPGVLQDQDVEDQKTGTELYPKLFDGQYYNLVNNVYGYHSYNASITLYKPFINQTIYSSRYIGYQNEHGFLITKAQNKTQKVSFSK